MAFEYQMLIYMTVFFLFAWVPASVGKSKSYGMKWVASNRDFQPGTELVPWAQRCDRAYENLKSYFPGFIVTILLLGQLEKFDETTKWLSAVYVFGRLGHFIVYGLGNVPLRALTFIVSMACNVVLLFKIIF